MFARKQRLESRNHTFIRPTLFLIWMAVLVPVAALNAMAAGTHWTDWLGPSGSPKLRANLKDEVPNAQAHVADVEVEVENVWLNFPDNISQSGATVGILRYEIDRCPPVATTETRIRFEHLTPGNHVISVELLGSGNRQLAPAAKLEVRIP